MPRQKFATAQAHLAKALADLRWVLEHRTESTNPKCRRAVELLEDAQNELTQLTRDIEQLAADEQSDSARG